MNDMVERVKMIGLVRQARRLSCDASPIPVPVEGPLLSVVGGDKESLVKRATCWIFVAQRRVLLFFLSIFSHPVLAALSNVYNAAARAETDGKTKKYIESLFRAAHLVVPGDLRHRPPALVDTWRVGRALGALALPSCLLHTVRALCAFHFWALPRDAQRSLALASWRICFDALRPRSACARRLPLRRRSPTCPSFPASACARGCSSSTARGRQKARRFVLLCCLAASCRRSLSGLRQVKRSDCRELLTERCIAAMRAWDHAQFAQVFADVAFLYAILIPRCRIDEARTLIERILAQTFALSLLSLFLCVSF